jgi:hypothetical protein
MNENTGYAAMLTLALRIWFLGFQGFRVYCFGKFINASSAQGFEHVSRDMDQHGESSGLQQNIAKLVSHVTGRSGRELSAILCQDFGQCPPWFVAFNAISWATGLGCPGLRLRPCRVPIVIAWFPSIRPPVQKLRSSWWFCGDLWCDFIVWFCDWYDDLGCSFRNFSAKKRLELCRLGPQRIQPTNI